MNLAQLLALSGINRNTFNTFNKRSEITFIEVFGVNSNSQKYGHRFGPSHALAMTVFARLKSFGISTTMADDAIVLSGRDIELIAGETGEEPQSRKCGLVCMRDGSFLPYNYFTEPVNPDDVYGEIYVDLAKTWVGVKELVEGIV